MLSSDNLAARVVELLRSAEQTISVCESLSAGLLSARLAEIPGASAVLRGGLVTYATDLKHTVAQVEQSIIDTYGVISRECACAMAQGAQKVCRSDWALSLTGVAGPDTQDGHPVGEVWVGIAFPSSVEKRVMAVRATEIGAAHIGDDSLLIGERNDIRIKAVEYALYYFLKVLE
ncbi:CinA family protein [Corynebacterium sp. sy017]|uniref:CinA family protein n=1 Tax=unclassified Corynebacterium TaxID=2624378 RepID=UPI0011867AA7|nr:MULTISPECIES: CinA family protein [unclassified Corynebacterium]MBP3087805.1 CinA family protein [Corynebacterium sp. sy017]QDZ42777.1 CinA family protein [Corynebacterium sp. sy039]TSD92350.1 CinA family protein [Corynebacterium sp. SY003]